MGLLPDTAANPGSREGACRQGLPHGHTSGDALPYGPQAQSPAACRKGALFRLSILLRVLQMPGKTCGGRGRGLLAAGSTCPAPAPGTFSTPKAGPGARPPSDPPVYVPSGYSSDNGPLQFKKLRARRHNHGKFWVNPSAGVSPQHHTCQPERTQRAGQRGRETAGARPPDGGDRTPRAERPPLTCTSPVRARSSGRRSGARCPKPARPGARG